MALVKKLNHSCARGIDSSQQHASQTESARCNPPGRSHGSYFVDDRTGFVGLEFLKGCCRAYGIQRGVMVPVIDHQHVVGLVDVWVEIEGR